VSAAGVGWLAWLLALPPQPSPWLVIVSGLPILLMTSLVAAGQPRRWRQFLRETADIHIVALVLLAALGVLWADTHGVTTDGVIYFSQLRSVIFDGDLDVASEFAYLQQPLRPSHVVPIGPTLVWVPLYAAVAIVDAIARVLGVSEAPVEAAALGLTEPYIRAALVSSFFIGAAGLLVLHVRLRKEFRQGVACAATALVLLATPLFWYMVYEPSMTHAASFGFVALFVVAAERYTSITMTVRQCLLLGALLGLACMTRPQEAVFALFPATLLLMSGEALSVRMKAAARLAGWALLGSLPFLLLQALHSWMLLTRERFVLAGSGGYLNPLNARWSDTLWSSWHGFFSWTPVAYLAFLGLFFYVRRNRRWAVAAILVVLTMAWINGATADWPGGWSFGGRRFISVLVVLAPAMALLVHGLTRRPMIALALVAACAIVWNQLLMAQYSTGLLQGGTAVSFGQIVRQQAAMVTRPPFFYPFAFPANAVFAWRNGLPLDRYDLLGPESLRGSIDVAMSGDSGKYLLDGWGARASDPFGELRWIEGDQATLLLPLDLPSGSRPVVEIGARTRLMEPPQTATFALRINGREVGTFTPDTQQSSTVAFNVTASDVLVRGFNRFAFERRGGTAPVGVYRIVVR
jgi:hypothetical protein